MCVLGFRRSRLNANRPPMLMARAAADSVPEPIGKDQ